MHVGNYEKFFSKYSKNKKIFRNFATKVANLLRLDKKRNELLCFVLDFS